MKKMTIALLLLMGLAAKAQTQSTETKPKIEAGYFTCHFLVSTDFSSVYFNFVGSGFKYTKGKTTISMSVYPVLRFHKDNNPDLTDPKRPFLTAGFALGPLIQYRRLFIGFPAFYDSHDVKWRPSVGIGVKIGQ
jgi:hypothetical protein